LQYPWVSLLAPLK